MTATLGIASEEARQQVNRKVVPELGTGLVAREPELTFVDENIFWRVPIVLSLPQLGDLGQVGTVSVDAQTGDVLATDSVKHTIIQHARRLYAGATLQARP